MVNPATQNNKVKTFLMLEAFKLSEQDLDATEEMTVKLYDFERFEKLLFTKKVNAQLFTATAYLLAKNYLLDNLYREP